MRKDMKNKDSKKKHQHSNAHARDNDTESIDVDDTIYDDLTVLKLEFILVCVLLVTVL